MNLSPTPDQHTFSIHDAYDVIALRQEVRQIARALGLRLPQQAKITAAISAVARALIDLTSSLQVTVHVDRTGPNPVLEIICDAVGTASDKRVANAEQELSLGEVGSLVDEVAINQHETCERMILRMQVLS